MWTAKSLSVLSIVVIFAFGGFRHVNGQESPIFVNPNVIVVRDFEGWGTSLAWWPDVLGHLNDDVIDEVTSALFSPDKLNLNIVRYTIGGTTPGTFPCGPYRTGAATESFLDGPDAEYDWTRDPRQRAILSKAKDLGVNIFEAFSNSPPQWMTIGGCAKGNPLGGLLHNNLDIEMADAFADYATEVIQHFHTEWGITFQTYAPFNEPFGLGGLGGWFGEQSGQEGCNMARPVMAAVLKSVDAALKRKNMDYVSVTAADETQMNTETGTQNYFKDNGVSNLYTKINVHGYWDVAGNRRDTLSMISNRDGHKLWMDEMGWEEKGLNDMTQGLLIANRILVDLKKLLPSAWVYWQAVEGYNQWGVMSIPYDRQDVTLEDVQYNSGYFAMMQFSRYIRQGYDILTTNEDSTLAAYDGSTLVIVIVNDKNQATPRSYSLNLFKSFGTVSATRTSANEQNVNIEAPTIPATSQLTYSAPPNSVTTIVISNAVHETSGNILQDGDFEVIGAWKLELGSTGGVNSESVWRGKTSGYLQSATSEIRLVQTVTAPKTGIFYLTAWASATGSGTKLGVLINNAPTPAKEISISKGTGYEPYALSFAAQENDEISVYFYSAQEIDGLSYIDDASLYYKESGESCKSNVHDSRQRA